MRVSSRLGATESVHETGRSAPPCNCEGVAKTEALTAPRRVRFEVALDEFGQRVAEQAAEMSCGMLAFQDEAQVAEDLHPSFVTLPDGVVDTALRTMKWLRTQPFGTAARALVSRVPFAVQQLAHMAGDDWQFFADMDSRHDGVPERLADAVVCLALCNVANDRHRQAVEHISEFDRLQTEVDATLEQIRVHVYRQTGLEL